MDMTNFVSVWHCRLPAFSYTCFSPIQNNWFVMFTIRIQILAAIRLQRIDSLLMALSVPSGCGWNVSSSCILMLWPTKQYSSNHHFSRGIRSRRRLLLVGHIWPVWISCGITQHHLKQQNPHLATSTENRDSTNNSFKTKNHSS